MEKAYIWRKVQFHNQIDFFEKEISFDETYSAISTYF